ncbi:hypothetical protein [Photobacterium leiognathi]|uniref:hypothetical protein n=1 Tax=Photobacterium leiognathi TaxID=553611 RepID=UPI00298286D6|nr:hypothetical protein [Photobacterium leiognathi]
MKKFALVVDESGSKGYSRKKGNDANAFGIMCGYLIEDDWVDAVRIGFNQLLLPVTNTINNGKLHITDLEPEQQEYARKIICEKFSDIGVIWFYSAIYQQGFYESVHNRGGDKKNKRGELLHAELFYHLLVKVLDYISKTEDREISISIISDTVDKKTLKEFEKKISDYVNVITGKRNEYKYTQYDEDTGTYSKFTMVSEVIANNGTLLDVLDLKFSSEDSSLTFVADILSNMAYYYIKDNIKKDSNIKLNSISAIDKHPLKDFVLGCYDDEKEDVMSLFDVLHRK